MAVYLLTNALLFGGAFGLVGLMSGDPLAIAWCATTGAVLGAFTGVRWHRQEKRIARYRSQFDPPGPTLTPGSLAPPTGPVPAVTRYRTDPASTIAFPILVPFAIVVAIWMSLNEDPFWPELLFWGIVLVVPLAVMLLVVLATFTEVGPRGIRLRTPLRSRMVTWSELAEVGWLRNRTADVVVLSTQDGKRVKTLGIFVSPTGADRDRALRMLADIEYHWANQAYPVRPGAATSIGPG